ncbi:MAG: L-tyrosine/L-tryptophan isonitrile synthase family protein [Alphaproteobacteria bacterium]|nr:L-tyrosine/L-tryptophan isonitrile synthase family protein [Alphaproteobacteria bacterium]
MSALPLIDFDVEKALTEARAFYGVFLQENIVSEDGVIAARTPEWAAKMLRKQNIVDAVMEKIGSNAFMKRRPQDKTDYRLYVQNAFTQNKPLLFRIPIGPVKNMNICGANQRPDMAEYFMFIQLARFAAAIAALYPFGVKIQLVPDDVRATYANLCPQDYVQSYVGGLRTLVEILGFAQWLQVENGQMRLCDMYRAHLHLQEAEEKLTLLKNTDPISFDAKWQAALENARKNFVVNNSDNAEQEIAAAAWRYMVAHLSEILSGMWSPRDAFPLVYANHAGNYQLFTMGAGRTRLPWQIALPANIDENLRNIA